MLFTRAGFSQTGHGAIFREGGKNSRQTVRGRMRVGSGGPPSFRGGVGKEENEIGPEVFFFPSGLTRQQTPWAF